MVMTSRYGGVRGKDAALANVVAVMGANLVPPTTLETIVKQLQGEQARVSLIHMVSFQPLMAQGGEHSHSADSQDDFLA